MATLSRRRREAQGWMFGHCFGRAQVAGMLARARRRCPVL